MAQELRELLPHLLLDSAREGIEPGQNHIVKRYAKRLQTLGEAVESLARATNWLIARLANEPEAALAGASPYLQLFGLATGGCLLARQALAAIRLGENAAAPLAITRFFAENLAVGAGALERTVVEGASGVIDADAALALA